MSSSPGQRAAAAIRVRDLWKEYLIGAHLRVSPTFREMLSDAFTAPVRRFRRLRGMAPPEERIWALREVDFEVEPGEVVGIIGRNGAGKSTLLKVLSRITPPTRGRIEIVGRLASLLEVGTGFHQELTGRENIYLNGAILGMSRAEIDGRFDEIVDFSGVERFLDTPVKHYSSGMSVRLAFAVAAHLEPEILLVDEVLAVGDMRFQRKCLGKMSEVSSAGRTILFVSHNMGAVSSLCDSGIVMREGQATYFPSITDAVRSYSQEITSDASISPGDFRGSLTPKVRFTEISINGQARSDELHFSPSETLRIRVRGTARQDIGAYRTTIDVLRDGHHLLSRHDSTGAERLPRGAFQSEVEIPPFLLSPGEYWIDLGGRDLDTREWTWGRDQLRFVILDEWSPEYDTRDSMGLVNLVGAGRRTTGNGTPESDGEDTTGR